MVRKGENFFYRLTINLQKGIIKVFVNIAVIKRKFVSAFHKACQQFGLAFCITDCLGIIADRPFCSKYPDRLILDIGIHTFFNDLFIRRQDIITD